MLLRREAVTDIEVVDAILRAAFADPESSVEPIEARLVRELRGDVGWVPALSLVAEDASGTVVGYVVCTIGSVDGGTAVGLGPLSVLPDHQRTGVGTALMHAVLGAADALGYAVVVLLGHLDYYPRFGFVPARSLGITPTDSAWGDHFQARPLSAWSAAVTGTFRYAAPFDRLG